MRRLFLLIFLIHFSLSASANQTEYPLITPENLINLREVEAIGLGALNGSLAWSPDGSQIVAGGARGIFLFDSNFQNIGFIDMGKPVSIQQFAPDGSFVFASFDGKLNAFDLETQTVRYQLENTRILAVSENEQLMAYPYHRSMHIAEVSTGQVRHVLDYSAIWNMDYSDYYGHRTSNFAFVQFTNNDEQVLLRWNFEEVSDEGGWASHSSTTDIWTLADNSFVSLMDEDNAVRIEDDFVAYDSNGDEFHLNNGNWYRGETTIPLFPSDSGLNLDTNSSSFTLKGNLLAAYVGYMSQGESDFGRVVSSKTAVWNIQTGELITLISAVGNIRFSPDETKIAISNNIFDLATGERLAILQNDVYQALSVGNDRILKYAADNTLQLLDALTMEVITVLPIQRSELKEIRDIFSDDSLLFVHQNQMLAIRISVMTANVIARYESVSPIQSLSLSQNEAYLYTLSQYNSNENWIWDANTGEPIELPADFVPLLSDFPENRVFGWTGNILATYDLRRHEYMQEFAFFGTDFVDRASPSALRMSSDKQYLAVSFNGEGLVIRISSGEFIVAFHEYIVFNPSSTYLAYTDQDQNIWVLNLANGESEQVQLEFDVDWLLGLQFISDEILIISKGDFGGIRQSRSFNIITGLEEYPVYPLQAVQAPVPFAEANGLRFYNNNGLRIEWSEQPISLMLNPANYHSASLSTDGNRIYINYTDGRIGIWAVPE